MVSPGLTSIIKQALTLCHYSIFIRLRNSLTQVAMQNKMLSYQNLSESPENLLYDTSQLGVTEDEKEVSTVAD